MAVSSSTSLNAIAPWQWLRRNLFDGWFNSLLTIICLAAIIGLGVELFQWVLGTARWQVIEANLPRFFIGRYPDALVWRLWVILGLVTALLGMSWGAFVGATQQWRLSTWIGVGFGSAIALLTPVAWTTRLWLLLMLLLLLGGKFIGHQRSAWLRSGLGMLGLLAFPVSFWLLAGGLGLESVGSELWTGLVLTLLATVTSIILAFPFGVLFALGRRSELPVIRILCILYIEIVRGLPLIGILFLAQVMLPLFFPPEVRLDRVLRAIAGLTLFSSAYLAENIRAGLQAIGRGQVEAARALGLSSPLTVGLIVLPQALKVAIPALVNQAIGLLKNTSLLSIVGLVELVRISRSILANPNFLGRYAEVYLFVALIFWVLCFGISLASRELEKRLVVRGS